MPKIDQNLHYWGGYCLKNVYLLCIVENGDNGVANSKIKRSRLETDTAPSAGKTGSPLAQFKRDLASRSYDEQTKMLRPSSSNGGSDMLVQMAGGKSPAGDPYDNITTGQLTQLLQWTQRQLGLLGPKIPVDTKVTSVVDENGLATQASVDAYVGQIKSLANKWGRLTPAKRKAKLRSIINGTLASVGVPAVKLVVGGKARGSFNANSWTIKLNESLADPESDTPPNPVKLSRTSYHEARHAEQWMLVVRMMAGAGWKASQIVRHLNLPAKVVKAGVTQPLTSGSQKKLAEICYHTQYGAHSERRRKILEDKRKYVKEYRAAKKAHKELKAKGGASKKALRKARNNIKQTRKKYKAAYAGYKNLPNEVDAWRVGALIGDAFAEEPPNWADQFFSI